MADKATVELEIEVDKAAVANATAAYERLAAAIERVADALARLNGKHGGIEFEAIGDVVTCTVKPSIAPGFFGTGGSGPMVADECNPARTPRRAGIV